MEIEEYRISATLDKESHEKLLKNVEDEDRTISSMLRRMIMEYKRK